MVNNAATTLEIPQFLQKFTAGASLISVTGSTVGECVQDFISRFPETRNFLFNKNGKLFNDIDIIVNYESTYPERLARRVRNGDQLMILRFICGG